MKPILRSLLVLARVVALALMVLGTAASVFAQTTIAPLEYHVDLRPLVNEALTLLAVILTALAAWLAKKVSTYLHLQSDAAARSFLDALFTRALALAKSRLDGQPIALDTKSRIVAQAADYATKYGPDTLKRFGLDDDKLREVLQARLAVDLAKPAATTKET